MSGLDASIYQNIRPVEMPSPMDTAQKAMTLSELGMRQRQMTYQMGAQMATRKAIADNTDETGNVNKQGALSQLGKTGWGQQAMDLGQQFAAQDKAQAEARAAQADAAQKTLTVTGPAFDYLAKMPEDQRSQAYSGVIGQLKDQGIDVSKMDHPYDPQLFGQYYGNWTNSKPKLENMVAQSEINKNNMDPFKTGAEELGKFNEDVNNPTNRKMTGGLNDIVNRADRITALANAGAKPGETPEQRAARLNKIMPQIAKEFNISLATIMQGGVPTEGLNKELGTDTVDSAIAGLKQRFSGTPEGANQAALIQQYVDTAGHLRNFAAGRLKDITDRSKAAYPYASKHFPEQMNRIATQSAAPDSGSVALAKGGSGILESSASASERTPKQSPLPDGMVRVKGPDGKTYRIPKSHQGEAIAAGGNLVK